MISAMVSNRGVDGSHGDGLMAGVSCSAIHDLILKLLSRVMGARKNRE